MTLGYDVDKPWRELPKKDRDWICLPTNSHRTGLCRIYCRRDKTGAEAEGRAELSRDLHGRAEIRTSNLRYDAKRDDETPCGAVSFQFRLPGLQGQAAEAGGAFGHFCRNGHCGALAVAPARARSVPRPYLNGRRRRVSEDHPEKALVVQRISEDLLARLEVLLDLGLGYLTPERSTPTLSPGELQRLRLATQVRSNLFGVVYVLDEPSAGLHPADTEALLRALDRLKAAGQFAVRRRARTRCGASRGLDRRCRSGRRRAGRRNSVQRPVVGPRRCTEIANTALPVRHGEKGSQGASRSGGWIKLRGVTRNNLDRLDVDIPLGVFTSVTGISGSGKVESDQSVPGRGRRRHIGSSQGFRRRDDDGLEPPVDTLGGEITTASDGIKRLVVVDQKPIGRTPRSNLATYTGLFDHVRKLFAATKQARARRYDAGRFSFNVAKGRCETCQGEGFRHASNCSFCPASTLLVRPAKARDTMPRRWNRDRDRSIADVLGMTVDGAFDFFADDPRFAGHSACFERSAWATFGLASRRPSFPAARPSASSWPPNCNGRSGARRCTSSTNRRRACTHRTWRS